MRITKTFILAFCMMAMLLTASQVQAKLNLKDSLNKAGQKLESQVQAAVAAGDFVGHWLAVNVNLKYLVAQGCPMLLNIFIPGQSSYNVYCTPGAQQEIDRIYS